MVNRIRYFGKLLNPAPYERGFGVSSLLIRLANWARVKLEQFVILRIMRIELARRGMTLVDIRKAEKVALEDPTFDPSNYHDVLVRSPRSFFREAFLRAGLPRALRYQETPKTDRPIRPVSLEEGEIRLAFAKTAAKTDRSARYVTGRRTRGVVPDGDFDDV